MHRDYLKVEGSRYLCPICNSIIISNSFVMQNVPKHTFNFSDEKENLIITQCDHCGTTMQAQYCLNDDFSDVYRSIRYIPKYREQKKQQLQSFIKDYCLEASSFLEVGCGDGQILEIFDELGIKDLTGIETGKDNCTVCKDNDFNVIQGTIVAHDGQYDCACCFHYLEHLPDPIEMLNAMYEVLNPSGYLLIEVPNYDVIERDNIWLEFTKDHLYYFKTRAIQYMLFQTGFEIIDIDNETLTLSVIARKPEKQSLDGLKSQMQKDVLNFKKLLTECEYNYSIIGAGHYTRLLLNQVSVPPKHIFDSNPNKIGNIMNGVCIQDMNEITDMNDCNNIIISCGAYNDMARQRLLEMNVDRDNKQIFVVE